MVSSVLPPDPISRISCVEYGAQGQHVGIRARFSGKRAEVGRDIALQYRVNCAL
jgi:hypothetical protein